VTTLKDRLTTQLQEMVDARTELDLEIRHLRDVVKGIPSNGEWAQTSEAEHVQPAKPRRARGQRRIAKPVSVSDRRAQFLSILGSSETPLTTSELAAKAGMGKSGAASIIKAMVGDGALKEASEKRRAPGASRTAPAFAVNPLTYDEVERKETVEHSASTRRRRSPKK
jgi:hypothetical protein